MRKTLTDLVELQRLDDALRELRAVRQKLATLTQENAEALAVFDRLLEEHRGRIEDAQSFYDDKLIGMADADEEVQRRGRSRQSLTTQRELTALNKELDQARRLKTERTEELGKLREQLEATALDISRKDAERAQLRAQMEQVEQEVRADLDRREAEAEEHSAQRERIQKELPAPVRARYERIASARGGTAVVDVINEQCTGCNMSVRPQVVNKLRKIDELKALECCPYCQRILVDNEALGLRESAP